MTFNRRIRRPSGDERLARATLVRLSSAARLVRVSLVDITDEDRTRRELDSTAAILAAEHESSPDGILVVDPKARYLSVNRRYAEIFGIPPEIAAARDDEAMRALVWRQVRDADKARVRFLYEHPEESAHDELVLLDGRVLDRITAPFRTSDGKTLGRIWYFRDITERRKAEDALRASEERFRMLVEEAPDAILLYDVDQRLFVAANKAAERLFGVSREELLARGPTPFYPLGHGDAKSAAQVFADRTERTLAGEEVTYERQIRRPSGEERLARTTLVRLPANARLIRASLVDVTEQDQARRALASTAAILATEHDSSPDGILVVDSTARVLSVNRRFGEMFDVPNDALATLDTAALNALTLRHLTNGEAFLRSAQRLWDHPDDSEQVELALRDGRIVDCLTSPFRTADGERCGRIWFFRDITERRTAEEALRASEERFRTLIEEAPDAILLYDVDEAHLVTANKAAERLFGASREEIARRGPQSFYTSAQPDSRPASESFADHSRRALAGEEVTFERRIRRPSGEQRVCRVRLVRLSSTSRLLRSSLVDITDQRATEAQLSEVLRGMVALQEAERQRVAREFHDSLNQYLAALTMKLELLGRSVPGPRRRARRSPN